jgi:cell division transport system permease protein
VRALGYALDEALISLRRNGRSALLSIGTVAVAFLTLGLFLLAATNLQRAVEHWGSTAEIAVFLRDDVAEEARTRLAGDLGAHAAVERVEYVSREDALTRFRSDFPELADMAADESNPFPPSIDVQLRADAAPAAVEALVRELRTREGVLDVRYDREWVERLLGLVNGVRVAGLALTSVLVLGAGFTVAAIVRLSLFARRDEVEIMRLVGAPYAYLRGPSIAEGALIGGLGALVALLGLFTLYRAFKFRLDEVALALGIAGDARFLGAGDSMLMLLAALLLGGLTGAAAARSIR